MVFTAILLDLNVDLFSHQKDQRFTNDFTGKIDHSVDVIAKQVFQHSDDLFRVALLVDLFGHVAFGGMNQRRELKDQPQFIFRFAVDAFFNQTRINDSRLVESRRDDPRLFFLYLHLALLLEPRMFSLDHL